MQEIRLKNPYQVTPEQKVTLLWHDIVLAKERRKTRIMKVLLSVVFFVAGLVCGLALNFIP